MRRATESAAVIAGFTALTLAMTWPVAAHFASALPRDLGDPVLVAWILAWDAGRMLHAFSGVWTAPIFFPYPNSLAYSEHLIGIAVLVAPVQWLFRNPAITYNVAFVLSYVVAGAGMYLLIKSLTGDRWAALIAGLIFAFCPYRGAQLSHLQVLTAGWMPVSLWGLHELIARPRVRALAVFVGAYLLQVLSNGYSLYFFSAAVAVVALHGLVRARRHWLQYISGLALAAVAIAIVLYPVAAAYFEVKGSLGLVRNTQEIQGYSANVRSYFDIAPHMWLWGERLKAGQPEGELFAGATAMALAAAAIVLGAFKSPSPSPISTESAASGPLSIRSATWLYVAIGLVGFALSLGPVPYYGRREISSSGPYAWLLSVVPGLDGLRVPSRFAMVVFLAIAVLAGMAIARLFAHLPARVRAAAGVLLAAAILVEGYPGPMIYARTRALTLADTPAYQWLTAKPPGGVLELPVEGPEPLHSLRYQYRTLEHEHPIVNGFSGYISPLVGFLTDSATPLNDPAEMGDVLRGLRRIGVRYVIFHRGLYPDFEHGTATLGALRAAVDQIAEQKTFETTTVLELKADQPRASSGNVAPIPASAFHASASHQPERIGQAFDGDVRTRWISVRRQTGDEWILLEFDRPQRISRVRFLTSSRSSGDFARRLRIDASSDGTKFDRVLFEDNLLPLVIDGIAKPLNPFPVDIDVEPMDVKTLRLSQVGQTRVWFWSVDELQLFDGQGGRH